AASPVPRAREPPRSASLASALSLESRDEFLLESVGEELQIVAGIDQCVLDAWREHEQAAGGNIETALADDEARQPLPDQIHLGFGVKMQRPSIARLIAPG